MKTKKCIVCKRRFITTDPAEVFCGSVCLKIKSLPVRRRKVINPILNIGPRVHVLSPIEKKWIKAKAKLPVKLVLPKRDYEEEWREEILSVVKRCMEKTPDITKCVK